MKAKRQAAALASGMIMAAVAAFGQHMEQKAPEGYVSVSTLAKDAGLTLAFVGTNQVTLTATNATVEATAGSRAIKFQGCLVYLNGPVECGPGEWAMSSQDVSSVLSPLLTPERWLAKPGKKIILLDAGHGGSEHGAKVDDILEKNLTLDVVMRMKSILESKGYRVNLTRAGDETVNLYKRPACIKSTGSDLMVSVHFNKADRIATSGIETYVVPAAGFPSTADLMTPVKTNEWGVVPGNEHDVESLLMALGIQKQLVSATGSIDRGVKRARFVVLREATAPSVLVECGFLSNSDELAKIRTDAYRAILANAIAEGIAQFDAPPALAQP